MISSSVVARIWTTVANPSVTTSTPSVSRSAISHPTRSPASPATSAAAAAQTRNSHGSPNGQSTWTYSTPKAYIPMPVEPDDAEVGDPGEPELEVEQQREAGDDHDLEQPRDEEGVEPVEHPATPSPSR